MLRAHPVSSVRLGTKLLLLVVLAARALLPPGAMIGVEDGSAAARGATLTITLCTLRGIETVQLPLDGGGTNRDPRHHDAPCLFAVAGAAPLAAATWLPPGFGAFAATFVSEPRSAAPAAQSIVRSQTPRGPPLRA
jgi:hypothetical protein